MSPDSTSSGETKRHNIFYRLQDKKNKQPGKISTDSTQCGKQYGLVWLTRKNSERPWSCFFLLKVLTKRQGHIGDNNESFSSAFCPFFAKLHSFQSCIAIMTVFLLLWTTCDKRCSVGSVYKLFLSVLVVLCLFCSDWSVQKHLRIIKFYEQFSGVIYGEIRHELS